MNTTQAWFPSLQCRIGPPINPDQWKTWRHLRQCGSEWHAQCPNDNKPFGDRMVIDLSDRRSPPHVWCRFCGARARLEAGDLPEKTKSSWIRPVSEPVIDENIVDALVSGLQGREEFFLSRGLTRATIEQYKLGYHERYKRYAIPCYYNGRLHGVKYRIRPELEKYLKGKGEPYAKYISEKGGVNNVIYNDAVARAPVPYVLIDEGEMDALLLTQHGFPTISPFSGNNTGVAWRPEWRTLIRHIPSVYVIAQNDEPGELIAISRLHDLGRGAAVRPPQPYKDMGEWLKTIPPGDRQRELVTLLRLPPVNEDVWNHSVTQSSGRS